MNPTATEAVPASPVAARVELPAAVAPLFEPHRYKVLYSGRGAGKSWSVARALLLQAAQRPLRVLCAREVQRSIRDSVHELLRRQIELLGLDGHYEVLDTDIRGRNGSQFVFTGLLQHTVHSIKSYEGVDICWVEEAQVVSKRSWDILIPTIRAPGSEIWITFNPELDTDETWVRFVQHPPEDAVVIALSWRDNPWFPPELEAERRRCEQLYPQDYPTIWEGHPRTAVEGAIYAAELAAMIREQRLGLVPYDPRLRVYVVVDPGWADTFAVGYWQRARSELRCLRYDEYRYTRTDQVAAEIQAKRYNVGGIFLPHDGFAGDRRSGTSDASIFRAHGFVVRPVPQVPVEAGIRAARQAFARMAWDQQGCARLVECAKRYRRTETREQVLGEPLHDEYSHGMDMLRYAVLAERQMVNDTDAPAALRTPRWRPRDPGLGALGG